MQYGFCLVFPLSLPSQLCNAKNCNPQRPLRQQKSVFHLKRRQTKQPNLHLQKPGSCVSLLPVTRSRTRRGPKPRPCCGAARFHVSFHDKHFHRCTRILFIYSSVSPTAVFVGGAQQDRRKENNIYTKTSYMCDILFASVVIRLLSIRCIKSTQNSTKLTAVVFSAGSPTTFKSDTIQYPLICPPYL